MLVFNSSRGTAAVNSRERKEDRRFFAAACGGTGRGSAVSPELPPLLYRLLGGGCWLQLAVDLAVNQGVEGGNEGQALIGTCAFRQPAAVVVKENTSSGTGVRGRDGNAVYLPHDQVVREEPCQCLR